MLLSLVNPKAYAAMMHMADRHVGEIVELLEELGIEEKDTVLVLNKIDQVLEQLVSGYPKAEYWKQLGAMYGEAGNAKKQLRAFRAKNLAPSF